MKILKKEKLLELNPCKEGIDWFDVQKKKDLKSICANLLKDNHSNWAWWLLARLLNKKDSIRFAIYAAEQVIHIYEEKYPENLAPRNAINAAKKYLKNPTEANKEKYREIRDAYADAYAAAAAAYAAAYAANAAAAYAANAAAAYAYADAYAAAAAAYAAAYAANAAAAYAAAYAADAYAAYAATNAAAAYAAANAANAAHTRLNLQKKLIAYALKLLKKEK